MTAPSTKRAARVTLKAFASYVGVSVEFLREQGINEVLENGQWRLTIPYRNEFDEGGPVKVRERLAEPGRKYSWLIPGQSAHVYGEWRLEWIRSLGYAILGEGETDSLVGWYYDFPMLGLSGTGNAKHLEESHLVGLKTIYVVEEPGEAGATFVGAVAIRARELGFKGGIRSLRMPGGAKDPCDLHRQDPARFRERLTAALETAGSVGVPVETPPARVGRPPFTVIPGGATRTAALVPPMGFPLTELGNSERFVALFGDRVRYCHAWGTWLYWTGKQWLEDETGVIRQWAKDTVRAILREAADVDDDEQRRSLAAWARKSERRAMIDAMIYLAQPELPIQPAELDADRWLLNCSNGTIDLRTGELREHRRDDYITRLVSVDYDRDAPAPTWERFLAEVMGGSKPLVAFLRRAVGYSLTGDTSERVLLILWGSGANGKTTFSETLRRLLDRYALQTGSDVLMVDRVDRGGGASPDLARLKGARFVIASETDDGRRLAEARVKAMTGREAITARRLYAEPFEFVPEFKVWLATNHKPVIRGADHGIWSRIRLVPFTRTFADGEQDKQLPEKLEAEWPGILAWAVRGCLDWQRDGLGTPEEVRSATDTYRDEMDTIGTFFTECCSEDRTHWAATSALYAAFVAWCHDANERPISKKQFTLRLAERGFEPGRVNAVRGWIGVGLLSSSDTSDTSDTYLHKKSACKPHVEKFSESASDPADPSPGADREVIEL